MAFSWKVLVLRQRRDLCVIIAFESRTKFIFRVGWPQTQALAIISYSPVQDVVYVLSLKIAKDFQLIWELWILKIS
jgi:hypothetical protein